MEFEYFQYLVLPILIFLARIIDVGLGTIRFIFVSKGFKFLAPILGFLEVLIWIIVIKGIFSNVNHPILYVAYAAGFATGTFVGMKIEEKLSFGKVLIRIITQKDATKLIKKLKINMFPLTISDAQGIHGKVKMIFGLMKRGLDNIL